MSVPDIQLSPEDRELTLGHHRITLTPREADAIGYLLERRGQVVSRAELEKEVWGFRAGVRSQVVPVTMRRLRGRLGPEGPSILETIRGAGWRIPKPAPAAVSVLAAPTFGTPFHPRPSELSSIQELIGSGWRIVTVVGPGGSGKTRLVAELACSLPTAWAAVGGVGDAEGLLRVVLAAAGVEGGGTEALELSLAHRDLWIVLDEAEQALDAVRALVAAVPGGRFLVTSRQELGLPSEAIHQVSPLNGEAGESFLRTRLQASRWGSQGSADRISRVIELLDGLPLALELAAAHPFGLDALVTELESGQLPEGPGAHRLRRALERSFEPLSDEVRAVALALSLCECALPEEEITSWLGVEAVAAVRELASRSLLNPEGGGWQMLRTMRAFAREQPADWSALQRRFDLWLCERAAALTTLHHVDPLRAETSWARLILDCIPAAARVPVQLLPEFTLGLYEILSFQGSRGEAVAVVMGATERAPDSLLLRVLSCYARGVFDAKVLEQAERCAEPKVRMYAFRTRLHQGPETLDHTAIEALIRASVDRGWSEPDQLFLRTTRCRFLAHDDPERVRALKTVIRDAQAFPRSQVDAAASLMLYHLRVGDYDRVDELLTRCRTLADRAGVGSFSAMVDYLSVTVLAAQAPREGALAFEDQAVKQMRRGSAERSRQCNGRAGRLWYGLGDLKRALPLLREGTPITGPGSVVHELLSYAAELRCGDLSHRAELGDCGERRAPIGGSHGEVTWLVFVRFMEGEVELSDAEDEGAELAILQRRIVPQREAFASVQMLPWIRHLLEDWERRLAGLSG